MLKMFLLCRGSPDVLGRDRPSRQLDLDKYSVLSSVVFSIDDPSGYLNFFSAGKSHRVFAE